MQSSRGCYHACAMCLPCAFYRAAPGGGYRLRSIPNLVDEIEALYRRGTRLFLFDDEQFLPPGDARHARVEAFAQELARRELEIAFTIKCRPDDVEAGILRRLQEIGLLRVYVGIESGCQATLDLLGKGVTVQRNIEALATLDRLGLVADFFCLMFHPWSTLETIQAELAFLEQVIPQHATVFSFNEVAVYPGTPLARRLQGEGRGGGVPWPLAYEIADPRAELLRRLNGLIFGGSTAHDRIRDRITQAWFALLLAQRFHPQESDRWASRHAQGVGGPLEPGNPGCVAADDDAFVRQEDIHDPARVNPCAGRWAGVVHAACLRAEDALAAADARPPAVISMQLSHALRMRPKEVVVLVGGGGKTTLMFRLADELAASGRRVVTTMTTRIFVGQMHRAPARLVTEDEATLLAELPAALAAHRHVIVAGEVIVEQDKVQGVSPALLDRIAAQPCGRCRDRRGGRLAPAAVQSPRAARAGDPRQRDRRRADRRAGRVGTAAWTPSTSTVRSSWLS